MGTTKTKWETRNVEMRQVAGGRVLTNVLPTVLASIRGDATLETPIQVL